MSGSELSVLVISQYFPPETGAAPTRWDELTQRWSEEINVTVVTSAPDYPEGDLYDGYDNEWIRREERGDIDVFYTKTITSASGNLYRRSLKFIWFMLVSFAVGMSYTSPTVVVATSPQPLTGVSGWLIARMKGSKFVFDIRDLWPESILAVSDFDNRVIISVLEWAVRFLYRKADVNVVVSRAFIEPIERCGVDRSRITYHPNGINLDFYRMNGDTKEHSDFSVEQFTVSYVGTIGRAHGLSVVLDAAPELDDVQFLIVGEGAEREILESRASNLDNVVFIGRITKEEVPSVLHGSDVSLVHLKPRDIFETVVPSKLLEAMAAGLPVVLGVRGEAKRILDDADAGISIEPGNPEELVSAIKRLHDNEDDRREFGDNGREFVAREFDWDTIAEEYLSTLGVKGDRTESTKV